MRRATRWRSVKPSLATLVGAVVVFGLAASAPQPAQAFRLGGQSWPKRVITFRLAVAGFRAPVTAAIAQWNTSGVRIRFREVRSGKADVIVKTLPTPRFPPSLPPGLRCGATGRAGLGTLGFTRGFQSNVWLDRYCSQTTLIAIAAHEFGHVLGLNHTNVGCAVMSASGSNCADERHRLPWEYTCKVLRPDDVAGAIRRYGGTMRPMPEVRTCLRQPTPGPVSAVTFEPNPADSIASTRITWNNPTSTALQRIVVSRRGGACPNYPSVPGRLVFTRPGIADLPGEFVADVPAAGSTQSITDFEPLSAGRVCYAVWATGPENRYLDAATVIVDHPGTDTAASRIGLVGQVAPAPGVAAHLSWINPADPGIADLQITWSDGSCPATPTSFSGSLVGTVPATPGPAAFDHPGTTPVGPQCYTVTFRRANQSEAGSFSVQLG